MKIVPQDQLDHLLHSRDIHPVLIDVGASGPPRGAWGPIAAHSIYVGFDPDLRDVQEMKDSGFHRAIMINEAVVSEKGRSEAEFYLTRSPHCSSTLEPDLDALSEYLFTDLFRVERRATVPAATFDTILQRLALDRVHWFKTDSQGTDLRLFNSLPEPVRSRVLCVEVEPGLIDAYKGEDLFVDAHRDLLRQGFWLSDVRICGTVRIRQSTLRALMSECPSVNYRRIEKRMRVSPGWTEATYLRSLDHLAKLGADRQDYILLWAFAAAGDQAGFALDTTMAYEDRFGPDETSKAMKAPILEWLNQREPVVSGNLVRRVLASVSYRLKKRLGAVK